MGSAVYRNKRPVLTVEMTGGRKLGNCYGSTTYRITSTNRMSREQINALRETRMIGYGQEFYVKSQCDGKEAPAGEDEVPCVDSETGQPAMNPYSGEPYKPTKMPFFVYEVEDRVDSGD